VALERLKAVGHFYAPFDLPWLIRRVLGRLRPRALLIMETELWPNLIAEAQKAGLPICLINGRLSERSFGRYLQVRPFMKRLLGGFRLLCVQEPLYAQRFMALGAPEEAVRVVGNLKFELTPRGRPPRWLEYLRDDLVVVAGSTHRGEEALLGEVFSRLRGEFHSLRLLVAPRHPERLPQIEEELRPLAPQRASSMTPHAKVVLLDEMGVLMHAYSVASVAVVGGSFIPHGGQNPLEPAYWAKAVLAGPHMENFPFFKDMLQEGAALSCSAQSLAETLGRLLREPALRQEMGRRARRFYEARSGALDRTLQALKEVLG
jgi:3-deoxy-D-manno-octulosonic-acid transferase